MVRERGRRMRIMREKGKEEDNDSEGERRGGGY